MKCKKCKKTIPDESIFCMYCGIRLVSDNENIKVPVPKRKASGEYAAHVMVDGDRIYVCEPTEKLYYAKARALKAKHIDAPEKRTGHTLKTMLTKYVESNSEVLSPSTIRGYDHCIKNRFKKYQNKQIEDIDYQQMINDELKNGSSPKTVRNGYSLVSAAAKSIGFNLPGTINLPKVAQTNLNWLDSDQLKIFLSTVKDTDIEFISLLALHSLRESEICALEPENIKDNTIIVSGAAVIDKDNNLVSKKTNKTASSTRVIPIMIPRLLEIMPTDENWDMMSPSRIRKGINKVCSDAGLPEVACQGLRRTFASLCFENKIDERTCCRLGGWTQVSTIHKFYARLSQKTITEDIEKMQSAFSALM